MAREFMTFLRTYGIIGLAIAVIIGGKLNGLVTSLVDGVIMPLIGLIPIGGDWKTWGATWGGQEFRIGPLPARRWPRRATRTGRCSGPCRPPT